MAKPTAEDYKKWFGPNSRADIMATASDGVHRLLEFVVEEVGMVRIDTKDGVSSPVLSLEVRYIGKRDPRSDEVVDQELQPMAVEDTGFVFRVSVDDADLEGADQAGR